MALQEQTFTPDNVTMLTQKDGTVPVAQGELIIEDIIANSAVMQVGKYEEMETLEKEFSVFLGGVGAYWVAEGQRIQTSKPQWTTATMTAKKLGVIIPVSREYLYYKQSDFFERVSPLISQAFYNKFDAAVLLNEDNPFTQSVAQSIVTSGNNVEGEITVENVDAMIAMLNDSGYEPSAMISKINNSSFLRSLVRNDNGLMSRLYDGNSLDGIPLTNVNRDVDFPKGQIIAGDFDMLRYGIPYTMTYRISEDATLTTIVDQDDNPVNLFERELVALRVTMDIGMMIINDNAFAQIAPAVVGG